MRHLVIKLKRQPPRSLGQEIALLLNDNPEKVVVAVIPTLLSYFGTSPERYEVTEVEIVMFEQGAR